MFAPHLCACLLKMIELGGIAVYIVRGGGGGGMMKIVSTVIPANGKS